MAKRYEPKDIEPKWQKRWESADLFRTREEPGRPKFYALDFFPYPSGEGLSVGHLRNYIPTDVLARTKYMQGYNVLHPMGWDAFGLPAENEALAKKTHPAPMVRRYAENYKRQMKLVGLSFDWSREINSSSPEFYRWTQWIFLILFKRGLAYHAEYPANWCPRCSTVLANEEVVGGLCWRCDTVVEKKILKQWFFKITAYAERLLKDLEELDWPEGIKMMQRHWIGRSEGVEFDWRIADTDVTLRAFTTRIDTVYGATFFVVSPEHPLLPKIVTADCRSEVEKYQVQASRLSEQDRLSAAREKTGVFTGAYAVNPFSGEKIPVYVADYVLMGYGTGAIMGVPAHDARDFEFARRYGLEIRQVIKPSSGEADLPFEPLTGVLVESDRFSGLTCTEAQQQMTEWLISKGLGERKVNYRLRDWLISRQRYWGAPIPIIHCGSCGAVPVPEKDLPVLLPDVEHYEPTGTGESPLAGILEFVNVSCPQCGAPARRETDTMSGFACSSWYFLRFCDPHNHERAWDPEKVNYWMPVDCYVGGAEHAVMHLLYARFWTKVLYDEGLVPVKEPFRVLRNQGMLLAQTPFRKPRGEERLRVGEEGIQITFEEAKRLPPEEVFYRWEKMSKSRGNVVTPDEAVERFGADALRVFELFQAPFEATIQWTEEGMNGAVRFLGRVFKLTDSVKPYFEKDWRERIGDAILYPEEADVRRLTHRTIKKVTEDVESFQFNTAVAALMEFINAWGDFLGKCDFQREATRLVLSEAAETLLVLLSPFAPHSADEIWESLGLSGFTYQQPWPQVQEEWLSEDMITIVIQVNGKTRGTMRVPTGTSRSDLERMVLEQERVRTYTQGRQIERLVVVPGRLVNVVVK
jgi:leucyl-tRNA synthetase